MATAFGRGRQHDFNLFCRSCTRLPALTCPFPKRLTCCLADAGYQGIASLHPNSQTPTKKSKRHPLTKAQKQANRCLARARLIVEQIIGKLKVFRILAERYRNRRTRWGLRLNLIAALYNRELKTRELKTLKM